MTAPSPLRHVSQKSTLRLSPRPVLCPAPFGFISVPVCLVLLSVMSSPLCGFLSVLSLGLNCCPATVSVAGSDRSIGLMLKRFPPRVVSPRVSECCEEGSFSIFWSKTCVYRVRCLRLESVATWWRSSAPNPRIPLVPHHPMRMRLLELFG